MRAWATSPLAIRGKPSSTRLDLRLASLLALAFAWMCTGCIASSTTVPLQSSLPVSRLRWEPEDFVPPQVSQRDVVLVMMPFVVERPIRGSVETSTDEFLTQIFRAEFARAGFQVAEELPAGPSDANVYLLGQSIRVFKSTWVDGVGGWTVATLGFVLIDGQSGQFLWSQDLSHVATRFVPGTALMQTVTGPVPLLGVQLGGLAALMEHCIPEILSRAIQRVDEVISVHRASSPLTGADGGQEPHP
jgi:hypothetical protein